MPHVAADRERPWRPPLWHWIGRAPDKGTGIWPDVRRWTPLRSRLLLGVVRLDDFPDDRAHAHVASLRLSLDALPHGPCDDHADLLCVLLPDCHADSVLDG